MKFYFNICLYVFYAHISLRAKLLRGFATCHFVVKAWFWVAALFCHFNFKRSTDLTCVDWSKSSKNSENGNEIAEKSKPIKSKRNLQYFAGQSFHAIYQICGFQYTDISLIFHRIKKSTDLTCVDWSKS